MAVFNHSRTYGIEMEVATRRSSTEIADAVNAEFSRRGVVDAMGRMQMITDYNGYHHQTQTTWKVMSDATINGWELVSPPMSGMNGKAQLEAVCAALKTLEISVNQDCGLHVHHDVRNLSGQAIGSVFALYAGHHEIINMMVARSRRNNQWASNLVYDEVKQEGGNSKFKNDTAHDAGYKVRNAARKAAARNYMEARYVSLNIDSMFRQGTVEFRQHQGSVNASRIWNWVLFTQSFIEAGVEAKQFPAPSSFGSKGAFNSLYGRMRVSANYNGGNPDSDIYVQAYKFMAKRFKSFCKEASVNPKTLNLHINLGR